MSYKPLVNIRMGNWSITAHEKTQLKQVPRDDREIIGGNYVMHGTQKSYVGQTKSFFARIQNHNFKEWVKITLIQNVKIEMFADLRNAIEFGLTLACVGFDRELESKTVQLPSKNKYANELALDFFETFYQDFNRVAPHILGSRSRRNHETMILTLQYLRTVFKV